MACEEERTRLISQIASLLRENSVPPVAREAGLTLIAWLARRMPGESVSLAGKEEMLRRCVEHGYTLHGVSGVVTSSAGTNGAHVTNGAPSGVTNGAHGAVTHGAHGAHGAVTNGASMNGASPAATNGVNGVGANGMSAAAKNGASVVNGAAHHQAHVSPCMNGVTPAKSPDADKRGGSSRSSGRRVR